MPEKPFYVEETQILREIAKSETCRWFFTKHALEEMDKSHITAPDVKHLCQTGRVELEEYKQDILWRVVGKNVDGEEITAIVAVDGEEIRIKVVTAF
jgi:hypothetical protein